MFSVKFDGARKDAPKRVVKSLAQHYARLLISASTESEPLSTNDHVQILNLYTSHLDGKYIAGSEF